MPRSTAPKSEALVAYGRHMADLRRRAGLSIRSVAKTAGVDKNTILRLEAGLPVRNASRERICQVYGILNILPTQLPDNEIGQHYAKTRADGMTWHRAQVKSEDQPSAITSSPKFALPTERLRQGKLQLAQQFFSRLDCNLPQGKLRAGLFEVFGTSGRSAQPSGEALIYVLKGALRFEIGNEQFIIHAGEAATFDRTIPHLHEPHEMAPADLPAIFLYVQIE